MNACQCVEGSGLQGMDRNSASPEYGKIVFIRAEEIPVLEISS